jgi:hypothetical protein
MKRFTLVVSAGLALLCCVLLARAARTEDGAVPASPSPAARADTAAALDGSAGWHYRHSQPTHWRSCMLQP